ncbi:MAG TPA: murein biosynthesis integral membrane protein MurJ, partial [Candidatus Coatesbacteria bacterium]|nr:murein biosynthesis integral membrane protein MurJ [Candidatus Coatesbacteria bacterium]
AFAALFGAGAVNDAYRIAYALPYFFRRILGENAMAAYFLPLFVHYRENKGEAAAWRLANNLFNTAGLFTALAAGLLILAAPWLLRLIAPGFVETGNLALAVDLTRTMLPFMVLMTLSAVQMALLNAYRRFGLPSSGTVIHNLIFIASLYALVPLFGNIPERMIFGAALGVLAGGVLQLVTLGIGVGTVGGRWRPVLDLKDPGLKRIVKLMVPALFGLAVVRINLLVDNALASLLGEGVISALNYAERLLQFPLGVFGVALGTAILPTLATAAARGEEEKLRGTVNYSLRLALCVAVPATLGLVMLREPLVALFYQRGAFDAAATHETAWALLFYALGLVGYIGVSVVAPVFYSRQDTRTPVVAAAVAVGVNIALDLALMWWMRQGGLALASAVASFVNLGWLLWRLRRRMGRIGLRRILDSGWRFAAAGAVMAAVLWAWVRFSGFAPETAVFLDKLWVGLGGVAVGAVVFFLAARLFRAPELKDVLGLLSALLRRRRPDHRAR